MRRLITQKSDVRVMWYPRYADDSTLCRQMTMSQHGAYALLCDWVYHKERAIAWGSVHRRGRFEMDDAYRVCGAMSKSQKADVRVVLDRFFHVSEDGSLRPNADWDERLRLEAARPTIPLALKRDVLKRDGERCVYCGDEGGPFHLDHRLPWSRGGEHTLDNLVVACAPCNLAKSDMTDDEFLAVRQ